MGRLYIMAAFLLLFTASWTSAGTLDVLSDAVAIRAPEPRSPAPGAVVKAEFKSTVDRDPELSLDSDEPAPAAKSRRLRPNVKPKPAVAFKKNKKKAASTAEKRGEVPPQAAQKGANEDALELDLEKDLVLSPPPPRTTEEPEVSPRAPAETRPPDRPTKAKPKTKEAAKPQVKPKEKAGVKETPIEQRTLTRTVRKVRPLGSDPWSTPAGSYTVRPFHGAPDSVAPRGSSTTAPAPSPKAYLRDGIMVRVTPQPGVEPPQETGGISTGTDILNSALDLIGLPFAFISSMF